MERDQTTRVARHYQDIEEGTEVTPQKAAGCICDSGYQRTKMVVQVCVRSGWIGYNKCMLLLVVKRDEVELRLASANMELGWH